DLLVVCGVGDQQYDGWLATLNPVLYPSQPDSFNPLSKKLEGCPPFGADNVVVRPKNAPRPVGSVSPGLHEPSVGAHRVASWDPATLPGGTQGRNRKLPTE